MNEGHWSNKLIVVPAAGAPLLTNSNDSDIQLLSMRLQRVALDPPAA